MFFCIFPTGIWLVVGLAITRYLVVSKPFNGAKYRKVEFGNSVCMVVLIAAVLFNIPRWFHHLDLHNTHKPGNYTSTEPIVPQSQHFSSAMVEDGVFSSNSIFKSNSTAQDAPISKYTLIDNRVRDERRHVGDNIESKYVGNNGNATLEQVVGSCIAERRKLLTNLLIPEYAYLGKNPYYR